MNRFAAASAAVAVVILSAGTASASGYRIVIGDLDLGSPDGATRFDERVERQAQSACRTGAPLPDAQCVRRFRVEALNQLPAARRQDYARARGDRMVAGTPSGAR